VHEGGGPWRRRHGARSRLPAGLWGAVFSDFFSLCAEISYAAGKLEVLWEDEKFPGRQLSALVASKVFFYLEDYANSVTFALHAGPLFDLGSGLPSARSEYVETIVAKIIDEYTRLRIHNAEQKQALQIPAGLEGVVNRMLERCFEDKEYRQALGLGMETRRLDVIERAIRAADDVPGIIKYCVKTAMRLVNSREWRRHILARIVEIHRSLPNPDYVDVFDVLVHLDDSTSVAQTLATVVKEKPLVAFQLAFDLCTMSSQQFLRETRNKLPAKHEADPDTGKLHDILLGEKWVDVNLQFLYWNDNTDLALLTLIKDNVPPKDTVAHAATVMCNALMHAGTTRDTFLRQNLEWLARATHWARFTAAAGLGVIHKGHLKEGKTLLAPYLPGAGGANPSSYSEGGALYGLGIIHANHGHTVQEYILEQLKATTSNIVQHGACLGLGLAAMGTNDAVLYEELKSRVLYSDDAVSGEAAGVALGLIMLGSANQTAIEEMVTYAHQTEHEKIIRGLAIGLGLIMYGREEESDALVDQLMQDKDPILRYGAAYVIGMAYAGTSNNAALKRLLHIAVSDVSDDVRRAATLNVGFILFNEPEQVPRTLSLLSKSYNPHVRYGAALAVGVSCAGTAAREAIALLEPLLVDKQDYVRQGAMIGLAMVLIQTSPAREPKEGFFRKHLNGVITGKFVPAMAKFGAILAHGILDAGGRNVTVSLRTLSGHKNATNVVGLALFSQYWYWHPFVHFISLSFTPTAIIALNGKLDMPEFSFRVDAKPSLFAYPEKTKPKEKVVVKLKTAVLSVTKKKKEGEKDDGGVQPMELEKKAEETPAPAAAAAAAAAAAVPEAEFEIKQNPARVTVPQLQYVHLVREPEARYVSVRQGKPRLGVCILEDLRPNEETKLVKHSDTPGAAAGAGGAGAAGGAAAQEEVAPPKPFEFE
jgi:26S proteasome regulatory subunit N2